MFLFYVLRGFGGWSNGKLRQNTADSFKWNMFHRYQKWLCKVLLKCEANNPITYERLKESPKETSQNRRPSVIKSASYALCRKVRWDPYNLIEHTRFHNKSQKSDDVRVWLQLLHCLKFFHQTSDLSDSAALTEKSKAKSNVSNGKNGNVTMKNQMAEKNFK